MNSSTKKLSAENEESRKGLKSRRNMIKRLALAPILPVVLSASRRLLARTAKTVSPAAPQAGNEEPKPSPEAEALSEILKQRYGKFLSDDQMKELKHSIERGVRGRKRLREYKLKNSDEPCTVFRA